MRRRVLMLIAAVLVLGGAAVGYAVHARQRTGGENVVPVVSGQAISTLAPGQLLFRNTAAGPDFGRIASVPLDRPDAPRQTTDLKCDRFAAAAGTALCLAARPGALPPMTDISVLDSGLRVLRRFELPGTPSRARLSPDGRRAAWTLFVTGDSYAASGFSTRAGVLDLDSGELVKSIEELPVRLNGERYFAADVNFWGITFAADGNRFYATLGSKGRTYLVEGDYERFRGRVVRENVECPSLSPDGGRVAFKKREGSGWRLAVLDLAGGRETLLAETRGVDDQAAWLDGRTVSYALPGAGGGSDVWAVPADGSGSPKLLVTGGSSPVAVGG
ncbi:TolB family protein [Amycolatopsis anabasis]|uniref:TolB family protein n=1 Tax=Amycolatopsis anabasis TaxID=1840409 RepID=UPI00131E6562|nr:PD40 domain-containing protein [Amycolatopsis anabasis]